MKCIGCGTEAAFDFDNCEDIYCTQCEEIKNEEQDCHTPDFWD